MTKVLVALGAWRLLRVLAKIAAVVVIGGLLLSHVSLAERGHHARLVRLRHALAPIERQLQTTFEHAFKP